MSTDNAPKYISPDSTINTKWNNRGHYKKSGERKVRYETEVEAMIALAYIRGSGKARHRENRYYQCPACHGYHLTV